MWRADKLGLRNWIHRRDGFVAGGLLSPAALPIAFTANDQRVRMMRQAIQSSTRQEIVAERIGPFFEGAVAGDDHGAMLIAFADDVVEILGRWGRKGL